MMMDHKRVKQGLTAGEKAAIAVIVILVIIIIVLIFYQEILEYYEVFKDWYQGRN
jgi:cell division protein FtsL